LEEDTPVELESEPMEEPEEEDGGLDRFDPLEDAEEEDHGEEE
jgi:hypothetical protein